MAEKTGNVVAQFGSLTRKGLAGRKKGPVGAELVSKNISRNPTKTVWEVHVNGGKKSDIPRCPGSGRKNIKKMDKGGSVLRVTQK